MTGAAAHTGWLTGEAVIRDPTGLHARPAVRLTRLARGFAAAVEIRASDQAAWVNAKSPNAVMKLRAAHRTALRIRASGEDAEAAISALTTLVEANFDDRAAG